MTTLQLTYQEALEVAIPYINALITPEYKNGYLALTTTTGLNIHISLSTGVKKNGVGFIQYFAGTVLIVSDNVSIGYCTFEWDIEHGYSLT